MAGAWAFGPAALSADVPLATIRYRGSERMVQYPAAGAGAEFVL
jgi:hypothetical protein